MRLSLQETAERLGKTTRQVRYLIQTGRLQAEKIGGRWTLDSASLELSPGQQQAVERQERQLRSAVEQGLGLDGERPRRWSVRDIKAFQVALPLYRHCEQTHGAEHPATRALAEVMQELARGCHRFERSDKAAAYRAARDAASLALFHLLLLPGDAAAPQIDAIEQDLMAALAGLLRRLERRR